MVMRVSIQSRTSGQKRLSLVYCTIAPGPAGVQALVEGIVELAQAEEADGDRE